MLKHKRLAAQLGSAVTTLILLVSVGVGLSGRTSKAFFQEPAPEKSRADTRNQAQPSPRSADGEAEKAAAKARRPTDPARAEDEKAIRDLTDRFIKAFNTGDASAIATLFTEDARVISEDGEVTEGRDQIAEQFKQAVADNPGSTIQIEVASLRFVGADTAIEDGFATITTPVEVFELLSNGVSTPAEGSKETDEGQDQGTETQPPGTTPDRGVSQPNPDTTSKPGDQPEPNREQDKEQPETETKSGEPGSEAQTFELEGAAATFSETTRYTVVYVKKDGHWLHSDVRDYPVELDLEIEPMESEADSNYEHLQPIEWLVGDWISESPDDVVLYRFRWADNKNYLVQNYTIKFHGQEAMSGSQRIGWDPLTQQIRSWEFDSEGGFGEALWSRKSETEWIMKGTGVRRDGRAASATRSVTLLENGRIACKAVDRTLGGEALEDIDEYIMVRQPPQPSSTEVQHETKPDGTNRPEDDSSDHGKGKQPDDQTQSEKP
jgi:uncharacterized protein (TIGR02246 family)